MLYASRIADVADNLMGISCLQLTAGTVEEVELTMREGIELIAIAAHEMAEHRTRHQCRLPAQPLNQTRHVLFRIETQPMHARVEFDMDGEVRDALLLRSIDELLQQVETEHLRFEAIVEQHLERGGFWIHNHDVGSDARLAKVCPLVSHSHSQIIHPIVLQRLARLQRTHAIPTCLHHAHHLRLRFHETAIIAHIVDEGIEIHLQDGLVHLQRQEVAHLIETELTGTLDEHKLIAQLFKHLTADERISGAEHIVLHWEIPLTSHQFLAHPNHFLYTARGSHLCHTRIKASG